MDVGFTGAVVATLERVVEKSIHAIAVILVVLGCIDPSLCGNTVCTARRILETECFHFISQFTQTCSSTCPG